MGYVVSYQTCIEWVKIYQNSVATIDHYLKEIYSSTQALEKTFCAGNQTSYSFDFDPYFQGNQYALR